MPGPVVHITVDQMRILSPVISAQLVNAFYSALASKGVSAGSDPVMEKRLMKEIYLRWAEVDESIQKQLAARKSPADSPSR